MVSVGGWWDGVYSGAWGCIPCSAIPHPQCVSLSCDPGTVSLMNAAHLPSWTSETPSGRPLCLQVMATVLHHWHIITHPHKHTERHHEGAYRTLAYLYTVLNGAVKTNYVYTVIHGAHKYVSIDGRLQLPSADIIIFIWHPPPSSHFVRTSFQILPMCAVSSPLIFHHVAINILQHVIHQCNVINVKLPVQELSEAYRLGWGRHQAIIVAWCLKHAQ